VAATVPPGSDSSGGRRHAERTDRDVELEALSGRLAACVDPEEERRLREELVLVAMPVAQSIAARYRSRGEAADDLLQAARLGLVKAAGRYDPTVGMGFIAYAVPTISGEVKRYFRDQAWVIRPPRRIQELRPEVEHASAELTQQLNRSPTVRELAAHLAVDEEAVIESLGSGDYYAPRSLDAPVGGMDEGSLSDTVGGEDPSIDLIDNLQSLKPLLARLPPRDRRMLARRFFDEWTQEQIASEIGVTQMQVSRLLTRALSRLRAQMDAEPSEPSGR
jgi:RNA polymerase sigma-B factor